MALFTRRRIASPVVVGVLLCVLAALMYLQYQWAKQVADATEAHIAADLRKSILAWHLDLFRVFASPPIALRVNAEPEDYPNQKSYATRYLEWRAIAAHAGIVTNLYIWNIESGRHAQMLRLNPATTNFEPVPWPEKFESLRKRLQRNSSVLALAIAGASSPEEFFADHPQKDKPFQMPGDADDALGGWLFDPQVPALFHPIAHEPPGKTSPQHANRLSADWIVLEYDPGYLRKEILPALAQRYFSGKNGLEYDLAVVAGKDRSPIYSSDDARISQPDATMNLFGPVPVPSLVAPYFSQDEKSDMDEFGYSEDRKTYDLRGSFWFPVIHSGLDQADWYLLVKHRHGSLSEVFARVRLRDLAISLGIVFLLVVSMGFVVLASRRAQELARLQVDFVAGVSHDLRTPLAIMSLAADNLADGVVSGRQAVVDYGLRLQAQVRQLGERVEQVLLFASMNRNKTDYSVAAVELKPIIDTALCNTSGLLDEAGVLVELNIDKALPLVVTDVTALAYTLQNLITNGIKYGGTARRLILHAKVAHDVRRGTELQVIVEDHGIGIERAELDRIFEPFYRSPIVTGMQIRGTGLGLTLARRTVEAIGGAISVSSTPGEGSRFVLHLPCAEKMERGAPVETLASS